MAENPPSYDSLDSDKKGPRSRPISSIWADSKSVPLLRPKSFLGLGSKSGTSAGQSAPKPGLFDIFRRQHPVENVPTDTARTAVIEDVRAVVQSHAGSATERVSLLAGCAHLCARHGIDFSTLLQEGNFFHEHTVLYWAIVNHSEAPSAPFEFIASVLAHSAPLTPETIKEARRACIAMGNQDIFQFLRLCPEFGALPADDRFLLGVLVPPEEIEIETMEGPGRPFSVKFKIPLFRKRMVLSRQIKLEFVARERLWQLSFFTQANPTFDLSHRERFRDGEWYVGLNLGENSPRTNVDVGLFILDARVGITKPAHAWGPGTVTDKKLRSDKYDPVLDKDSTIQCWCWSMFGANAQADHVCIAPDGSITGILGLKLATASTEPRRGPAAIPAKPEDQCVVC